VVAPDRRGSGVNTAAPFQRGHARNADQLLDDLARELIDARRLAPGKPLVLLGTSWGSNLASAYCIEKREPRPDALVQLVPATKTRYSAFREFCTLVTRKLPFDSVHYLPGQEQVEGRKPGAARKDGEPPSNSAAGRSGPLWHWLTLDKQNGVLLEDPSRATIWAGKKLAHKWQHAEAGALPRMLVLVATRDQIMNDAAAIAAAAHATAPHQLTVEKIPAGHGAQISHPHEIARKLLAWLETAPARPK
jgi:pimeloyl-ACP methyl ester carboxylesterase